MTETFYVLECKVDGFAAEFWLNDIPVIRLDENSGFAGIQVNHLLVEGENEVEMVLFHGDEPLESKTGPLPPKEPKPPQAVDPKLKASVSLCKYPYGAAVGGPDRTELFQMTWGPSEETTIVVPLSVKDTCTPGMPAPRWKWQDADLLELDRETILELVELLESMCESIGRGDPEPFLERSAIRLQEIAVAYETDPAEKEDLIRRVIPQDGANESFSMEALDPAMFNFRLCGGGRLIEAIAKDWKPLVRGGPDAQGNPLAYDMILARIDGEWCIVR